MEKIKGCKPCSQSAPITAHAPLKPLISNHPMEIVEVDFFGPLDPDPETGHKYCF